MKKRILTLKNFADNGQRAGFTLFEIIISIALLIIIIILVNSSYIVSQQSYNKNSIKAELSQNNRVAMDRISRELRQSVKIVTTLPPTDTDEANPPANDILFQDGHNIDTITYIRYYLSGTDLMRERRAYAFDSDPNVYVYYDSLDAGGYPPDQVNIDNQIIGEYLNNIKFWGAGGIINLELSFLKNQDFQITRSSIYSRNQ